MIKKYNKMQSLSSQTVFSSLYGNAIQKSPQNLINIYRQEEGRLNVKHTRTEYNRAINNFDLKKIRELSRYFYRSNLLYSRTIDYLSTLLCYYWKIEPKMRPSKIDGDMNELIDKWWETLEYIEEINPEKLGVEISRRALVNGSCYIAVKEKTKKSNSFGIQFLPNEFCRVRKKYLNRNVIDFDVTFFDTKFSDLRKRNEALLSFPPCISEKYYEYKQMKNKTTDSNWMTIDPDYGFCFTLREDELPYIISSVLDILDLQDIKDITMFKFEQALSKLLVQKFGTNQDGNPIIDLPELKIFHKDACDMLSKIPGVDVLTTYADVDSVDLENSQIDSDSNPMEIVTQNFYNSTGVSKLLFNADNSGTLSKAIIPNESLMFILLKQINEFLQVRLDVNFKKGATKKFNFTIELPPLTESNKLEMAKMYKEQVAIGYSKFLPAIALGQRQSAIMSSFVFENDVLNLVSMMRPPVSSNTMTSESVSGSGEITEKTEANKETL